MVLSGLDTRDPSHKTKAIWFKPRTRLKPEHVDTVTTTGFFGSWDQDQDRHIIDLTSTGTLYDSYQLLFESASGLMHIIGC